MSSEGFEIQNLQRGWKLHQVPREAETSTVKKKKIKIKKNPILCIYQITALFKKTWPVF